ncbi:MAG: glycosyltransferase [Lachnospiraceae bacterium]|nr:glycosyltransferase [Lachnospiraceae bacterium]
MYSYELEVAGICLVYNNARYVRDSINAMASQNVNFRYKVYVYDNASTDNSKELIEEMYRRYPDIVIPMFANNHTDSWLAVIQDVMCNFDATYVALCMGDEFWADNNKLQLQFDFMENNADNGICTTNTLIRRPREESRFNSFKQEALLKPEDIFMDNLVHFSSFLMRKKVAECKENEYNFNFFSYIFLTHGYDYGKITTMPGVMSIIMEKNKKSEELTEADISEMSEKVRYLEIYDANTGFKHNRIVELAKDKLEFLIGLYKIDNGKVTRNDAPELKKALKENSYYNNYVAGLGFKDKIALKMKLK